MLLLINSFLFSPATLLRVFVFFSSVSCDALKKKEAPTCGLSSFSLSVTSFVRKGESFLCCTFLFCVLVLQSLPFLGVYNNTSGRLTSNIESRKCPQRDNQGGNNWPCKVERITLVSEPRLQLCFNKINFCMLLMSCPVSAGMKLSESEERQLIIWENMAADEYLRRTQADAQAQMEAQVRATNER